MQRTTNTLAHKKSLRPATAHTAKLKLEANAEVPHEKFNELCKQASYAAIQLWSKDRRERASGKRTIEWLTSRGVIKTFRPGRRVSVLTFASQQPDTEVIQ